jgi:hypothetical protein
MTYKYALNYLMLLITSRAEPSFALRVTVQGIIRAVHIRARATLILDYLMPLMPPIVICHDPLYIKPMVLMAYRHVLNYPMLLMLSRTSRVLGLQSCTV